MHHKTIKRKSINHLIKHSRLNGKQQVENASLFTFSIYIFGESRSNAVGKQFFRFPSPLTQLAPTFYCSYTRKVFLSLDERSYEEKRICYCRDEHRVTECYDFAFPNMFRCCVVQLWLKMMVVVVYTFHANDTRAEEFANCNAITSNPVEGSAPVMTE